MIRFVAARLLLVVPVLAGLVLLLFAWTRALPGDPARALLGQRATPAGIEAINELYGFDRPLLVQLGIYVRQLATGNLGTSGFTGEPVVASFVSRFPATIELGLSALVFAVVLGVPLGYFAARRNGRWLDSLTVGGSLLGVVVPVFFLAYLL